VEFGGKNIFKVFLDLYLYSWVKQADKVPVENPNKPDLDRLLIGIELAIVGSAVGCFKLKKSVENQVASLILLKFNTIFYVEKKSDQSIS
jgi:hypothetical protein